MAACGTKTTFITAWDAECALKTIARNPRPDENGNFPIRYYECPTCKFYHLTHYAQGESNYEKARAVVRAAMKNGLATSGVPPTAVAVAQQPVTEPDLDQVMTDVRTSERERPRRKYVHSAEWLAKKDAKDLATLTQVPSKKPVEVVPGLPTDAELNQVVATTGVGKWVRTPEQRQRQSESMKAKTGLNKGGRRPVTWTPEQRAAAAEKTRQYAAAHPEVGAATGVKIGDALRDKPKTPEHKAAIAAANKARALEVQDTKSLARLFLERLPLMTKEERETIIKVLG